MTSSATAGHYINPCRGCPRCLTIWHDLGEYSEDICRCSEDCTKCTHDDRVKLRRRVKA